MQSSLIAKTLVECFKGKCILLGGEMDTPKKGKCISPTGEMDSLEREGNIMAELITIAEYARRCQISVAGAWKRIARQGLDAYVTERDGRKYIDYDSVPHHENSRITEDNTAVIDSKAAQFQTVIDGQKQEITELRQELTRLKEQIAALQMRLDAAEQDKQRLYSALDAEQHLHAATQAQLYRMLPPAPEEPEKEPDAEQPERHRWWQRKR